MGPFPPSLSWSTSLSFSPVAASLTSGSESATRLCFFLYFFVMRLRRDSQVKIGCSLMEKKKTDATDGHQIKPVCRSLLFLPAPGPGQVKPANALNVQSLARLSRRLFLPELDCPQARLPENRIAQYTPYVNKFAQASRFDQTRVQLSIAKRASLPSATIRPNHISFAQSMKKNIGNAYSAMVL